MNYKTILALLVVLLASQAQAQSGGIIYQIIIFIFSLFTFTLPTFFADIFTLIALILSPITITPPSKALYTVRNSPIAKYAAQMNAMAAGCDGNAAAMLIPPGSGYSQSEMSIAETISTSYQQSSQVSIYLIMAILAVSSGSPPADSPFSEYTFPTSPPALTNASQSANITIQVQAQALISYIPFIIQQINSTGSACEDLSGSINASCNCPNSTTVQNVIALWNNVTVEVSAALNITTVNGTLLAYLNETTTVGGNLTAAINATNNLLMQQQTCAQCMAAAVKAHRYRPIGSCHRAAADCKAQHSKEIKRAASNCKRLRSHRRNKSKRAKASREKRVRSRGKSYFTNMGMGIGGFLTRIRFLFISEMTASLSIFASYFSQLQGNFTAGFNAIADNASASINASDTNLTNYINTASDNVTVAIANFTANILANTDPSSNCTGYANASLALLAYFTDEVQKCQAALDANTTAIYANITAQITAFGAIYNDYVSSCDRCVRIVCSSWLCFFRRRIFRDNTGVDQFQACQSDLTAKLVNETILVNITVNASISIIQTNIQKALASAEACVDSKVNLTMYVLSQLQAGYASCLDPNATTTAAPTTTPGPTTTVTANATTTAANATTTAAVTTTQAPTTQVVTTTTAAPYPTCSYGLLNSIFAGIGLATLTPNNLVPCKQGAACATSTYTCSKGCCCL
ncbi:hypothetical protein PVAND_014408 [Polypedilum vanderplanki]|uniref:Uncharacterized protein n=1 Tax=Polypedilum vanderplanki TaxID=319348 RepID=A0A9J6BA43_POLVA|nr:hypothetical protein PVAND_014408 [Polypedilum vanderplanki]